jgi:hypothetical protein
MDGGDTSCVAFGGLPFRAVLIWSKPEAQGMLVHSPHPRPREGVLPCPFPRIPLATCRRPVRSIERSSVYELNGVKPIV